MEFTAPTIVLALIIGYVAISILDAVARVMLSETAFWNLRCEVARLQQDYQFQLQQKAMGSTEAIEVDVIEEDELAIGTTEEFMTDEAIAMDTMPGSLASDDAAMRDAAPSAMAA